MWVFITILSWHYISLSKEKLVSLQPWEISFCIFFIFISFFVFCFLEGLSKSLLDLLHHISLSPTFLPFFFLLCAFLEDSLLYPLTLLMNAFSISHHAFWASLVAQLVENGPAMRETWVQSLG